MRKLQNEREAASALEQLYQSWGYTAYKMSRFEEYDLYVRNKDFLASDRIITFSGPDGRLLAMKPDVTLSIVKNAPEHGVEKVYYQENVYRDYREILQLGLECVGDLGAYEIAETALLAAKSLEVLDPGFLLNLSHMGLTEALLEPLPAPQKAKALECLQRRSLHELSGFDPELRRTLEQLSRCRSISELETLLPQSEALTQLREIIRMLDQEGFGEHVKLDFSIGGGLGYYNGLVFRGFLPGVPGPVLSGGQYDRLPRRMGRKARAIGFALGLDLLPFPEPEEDLDVLVLHWGAEPGALLQLRQRLSGNVLIARTVPEGRRWKKLIRFGEEPHSEEDL